MRKTDDPATSTDSESAQTFLGRWSRRKRGVDVEPVVEAAPEPVAGATVEPAGASAESVAGATAQPAGDVSTVAPDNAEPAPVLTDADMPDLASLGDDGDYSGFMSPGVSEALRSKALRQLFMSPQFNVLDGLNDYDEDFTSFEPLGDIVTADMRHRAQMEAERAGREAQARRLIDGEPESQVLEEEAALRDAVGHDDADAPADELAGQPGGKAATIEPHHSDRATGAIDDACTNAGVRDVSDEAASDEHSKHDENRLRPDPAESARSTVEDD